jgi:hypothetical protein
MLCFLFTFPVRRHAAAIPSIRTLATASLAPYSTPLVLALALISPHLSLLPDKPNRAPTHLLVGRSLTPSSSRPTSPSLFHKSLPPFIAQVDVVLVAFRTHRRTLFQFPIDFVSTRTLRYLELIHAPSSLLLNLSFYLNRFTPDNHISPSIPIASRSLSRLLCPKFISILPSFLVSFLHPRFASLTNVSGRPVSCSRTACPLPGRTLISQRRNLSSFFFFGFLTASSSWRGSLRVAKLTRGLGQADECGRSSRL